MVSHACAGAASACDNLCTVQNVLQADLAASADPDINAIQNALLNATTRDELDFILESALPVVNMAEVQGVRTVNKRTFGLINHRLAMLRGDRGEETGVNGGGKQKGFAGELDTWWEFYGQSAEQAARASESGYESTTYGLAVGVDKELFEDMFLGFSFSWGESSADSKGAGNAGTDVDSYQISLYGDYDMGRSYVNGMVSYSYNDLSTARTTVAGTRKGNFHANHYALRGEYGYAMMKGKTRLIPHLIGQYDYYSPESYTEGGAAAQIVTGDSVKRLELGMGLDMQWYVPHNEGSYFVPELRLGYRYDFAGDRFSSDVQFVAGGPSFEVIGADPAAHNIDMGFGVTYFSKEDWELLFNYDFDYNEDYTAHAGTVRASYKFPPE